MKDFKNKKGPEIGGGVEASHFAMNVCKKDMACSKCGYENIQAALCGLQVVVDQYVARDQRVK